MDFQFLSHQRGLKGYKEGVIIILATRFECIRGNIEDSLCSLFCIEIHFCTILSLIQLRVVIFPSWNFLFFPQPLRSPLTREFDGWQLE